MIWFDTEIVQMIKVSVKNVFVHEQNLFLLFDKNLPWIQKHKSSHCPQNAAQMYISLQTTHPPDNYIRGQTKK